MPQHLTISYKLESTNPDLHMKENTLLTCVHHLVFGSPPPHSCIIQILDHINSIEMTYWMPGAQAASSYLFHPWLLLFSQSLVLSWESPFMPLLLFSLKCGSVSQGLRFQFFVQLQFYSPPHTQWFHKYSFNYHLTPLDPGSSGPLRHQLRQKWTSYAYARQKACVLHLVP